MQRESFSTVEHTSALSAGVLEARRRFSADCGDQVVRISNYRHCLRLLLDVLNLNLLLLLLLLSLLLRLLLGCLSGGRCLLLRLLLSLLLCLGLCLSLRLLLLNHRGGFVCDDCRVGRVGVESTVHQSIVSIELRLRCKTFAACEAWERSFTGVSSRKRKILS